MTTPNVPDKYAAILAGISGAGAPAAAGSPKTNRESGKYYGVPDDYVAEGSTRPFPRPRGPQRPSTPARAPRYQTASDDDRRIPLSLPPEQLADLQDALMEVGLIGKSGYRKGVVDKATREAFAELLGFANQTGADWRQALMQYAAANPVTSKGKGGAGGAGEVEAQMGRPGDITRVTAAADLAFTATNTAERRLGRKLSNAEAGKFASTYQGIERRVSERGISAQDAAAPGLGINGASSEMIGAPDVGVAADQFIDSNFAQEAAGQSAYSYFEALQQMLGGR